MYIFMDYIRNFCIIAHIDHGKSTLADRMLEITGTIEKRKMREQVLDRMDLERERGITIKLQPVTMEYNGYILNLIDTPGHVDFTYEVSRSLAAVEGAILLVDASQGIQAQTLANLYLALEQNLTIIPVINKIDLPAANINKTKQAIIKLLGCSEKEIICVSAKTGQGVSEILPAVIERLPAPVDNQNLPLRALIFDSTYDEYRGVVADIRVVDGQIRIGDKIHLLAANTQSQILELGIFKPEYRPTGQLVSGEIGYLVTGFKQVSECSVGDTVVLKQTENQVQPLKGYNQIKPMVYAGIFPAEGNQFLKLREALAKLKLNDAALVYQPENSTALGFGFRAGFLGLLHLEIFQERLKREYNLDLIVTTPSVAYKVEKDGQEIFISNPQQLPANQGGVIIQEPWVSLEIITPKEYLGAMMKIAQEKRGVYQNTEYLNELTVILHYQLPLTSILTDFYDQIKGLSAGYASINYQFLTYRPTEVVKLDILIAEEPVEALATIIYRDQAYRRGRQIIKILKQTLPRQWFVVKLQAAVGGKIIAAEKLPALRKDVTAKLYGGDVSRKKKLLEKQKKGKKKMMATGKGKVIIPGQTFIKILKNIH